MKEVIAKVRFHRTIMVMIMNILSNFIQNCLYLVIHFRIDNIWHIFGHVFFKGSVKPALMRTMMIPWNVFLKCDLQHLSPDEVVMVSKNVLQKTNTELQRLRMSIFKQLQPKLHCKLGESRSQISG